MLKYIVTGQIRPIKIQARFDFTGNLLEVCDINGEGEYYRDDNDNDYPLSDFDYLLDLEHFFDRYEFRQEYKKYGHGGISYGITDEDIKKLNPDTKYIDYICRGTPEPDGDGYFLQTSWGDDSGNEIPEYEEHHCPWSEDGLYNIEYDLDFLHTRYLEDDVVLKDWRIDKEYKHPDIDRENSYLPAFSERTEEGILRAIEIIGENNLPEYVKEALDAEIERN